MSSKFKSTVKILKVLSFTLSLCVLTFALYASPVLAQTATLSLDPSNGTFNQGCGFSLNINLDTGGANTEGVDVIVLYDSSRLIATSVTKGTIFPDYPISSIDATSGKIAVSAMTAIGSPFSGRGTVATINFTVPGSAAAGATQVTFDFNPADKTKTTDSNVSGIEQDSVVDLLGSVTNGSYTIGTGTCSAQPTPSPTVSSAPVSPGAGVTTPPTYRAPAGAAPAASTPAAQQAPAQKALPPAGSEKLTFTMAIMGGILTVLGILGLAVL